MRRHRQHRVLRVDADLQQPLADQVMQFGGGHGPLRECLEDLAQKAVGIEQHLVEEEHVVDADDARLVQIGIVELEAAAMERIVERVVNVVVEVGAGADHEVYRATLHQGDDAAADASGRHRASDGQADGDILLRVEHALGVEARRLVDAPGVIRLK